MDNAANRDSQEPERKTAWHPLLVTVLDQHLPLGCEMIAELLLNRLPQRVDIVVIRKESEEMCQASKLRSIFNYLGKHTLIEHKGPTDDLEAADVLTLLAYAGQYMRLHKVLDPRDMRLMVVADRIPSTFVKQIERMDGKFVQMENGLWQGKLAGLPMHGVELREAYRTARSERLLYMFSREHLENPRGILPLDTEETRLYSLLAQQVRQLRRQAETMPIKDLKLAAMTLDEVLEAEVKHWSTERILSLVPIEERVAGLTPEQRFAGLTPEQRFAGLTPEQLIAALPAELLELVEQRLKQKA